MHTVQYYGLVENTSRQSSNCSSSSLLFQRHQTALSDDFWEHGKKKRHTVRGTTGIRLSAGHVPRIDRAKFRFRVEYSPGFSHRLS